jgi:hypothetical protein
LNVRKKIKSLGFTKSEFLKPANECIDGEYRDILIPDDWEWGREDGKSIKVKKHRVGYESFWKLKSGTDEIYLHMVRDNIRKVITYDGKKATEVWPKSVDLAFQSKNDILNLFPKGSKRSLKIELLLSSK